MSLPLPNLDDRRWIDLVDEGRTLIPVHAPGWTDHNLHDPGITFLELLAWVAEMDIYRTNRIPRRHREAFLALAGVALRRARGARAAVGFELSAGDPVLLPAGLELISTSSDRESEGRDEARFRTTEELTAIPGRLVAVQSTSQSGAPGELVDLAGALRRGAGAAALGEDPALGSALYLGLSEAPPVGVTFRVQVVVEGGDGEERARILAQRRLEREACEPPEHGVDCEPHCASGSAATDGNEDPDTSAPLEHHSARLVWEHAVAPGVWRPLDHSTGEIEDHTRALTLDGAVLVRIGEPIPALALGRVQQPLHYLRARLAGGCYDAPPRVRLIQLNGVEAVQETAVRATWTIARGAAPVTPPSAGELTGLRITLDARGEIDSLERTDEEPRFFILAYRAPSASVTGALELELAPIAAGTGRPEQECALPRPQVAGDSLRLLSLEEVASPEEGGWRAWTPTRSLRVASRRDAHFELDGRRGRIALGDGEHGRVLPRGALLAASYDATRGAAGNRPAGSLDRIATDAPNRARVTDLERVIERVERVVQTLAASGGADAETLGDGIARSLDDLERPQRAITVEDIERLALETPGARIARVKAIGAAHPAFPCLQTAGVVSVVVLPFLPAERPMPSRGLRRLVGAWLAPRRVLGTRIVVAAPQYVAVTVRARVRACSMVDPAALAARLRRRLDDFFHPLRGGPRGEGWMFGRDVYRSEVLQVLDESEGVDCVLQLELVNGEGTAVCGNLCLPPCGLVDSGEHRIEVIEVAR